jgi:ABC-type branched-subunit amino acid transport system ATPase component
VVSSGTLPAPESVGSVLRATGLSKSFDGVLAIDGVDLALVLGKTIGLLGPNGSGKTTLVNCLSGVFPPTDGDIYIDGERITRHSRAARAQLGLARTYQNLRLFPALSVAENIEAGLMRVRPKPSVRLWQQCLASAIDDYGLAEVIHRPVSTLPYGLQKRTEIARATIGMPRILLLDEPAAGLGTGDCEKLAALLKRAQNSMGFALLLIDHNVAFVTRLADSLMVLANGRAIRHGAPADVLGDKEVARIYLGDMVHAAR